MRASAVAVAALALFLGAAPPRATAAPPRATPPGAVDFHPVGPVLRTRPTVVLTHGMQGVGLRRGAPESLWLGDGDLQAAALIRDETGRRGAGVNILRMVWDDAFQMRRLPDRLEYVRAWHGVANAGQALAAHLEALLGSLYDRPIHFIGHSLGAAVNVYAAQAFLSRARHVTQAQITALERPSRLVNRLVPLIGLSHPSCISSDGPAHDTCGTLPVERRILQEENAGAFERRFAWSRNFMAAALQELHREFRLRRCRGRQVAECGLRIENYFSHDPSAAGDVALGPVFNQRLIDPKMVGNEFFRAEGMAGLFNHSGVQQWYRWTIDTGRFAMGDLALPEICYGADMNDALLLSDTLIPCRRGWNWSFLGPRPGLYPASRIGRAIKFRRAAPRLRPHRLRGCTLKQPAGILTCGQTAASKAESKATLEIDLPGGVEFLDLEFRFSGASRGVYAALSIDGWPRWKVAAEGLGSRYSPSGPIPLGLARPGQHRLTVALYRAGGAGARIELRNWRATGRRAAR